MVGVYAGYDTRELKAGQVDTTVTVTDPRTIHFQQVAVGAEAVSNHGCGGPQPRTPCHAYAQYLKDCHASI